MEIEHYHHSSKNCKRCTNLNKKSAIICLLACKRCCREPKEPPKKEALNFNKTNFQWLPLIYRLPLCKYFYIPHYQHQDFLPSQNNIPIPMASQ